MWHGDKTPDATSSSVPIPLLHAGHLGLIFKPHAMRFQWTDLFFTIIETSGTSIKNMEEKTKKKRLKKKKPQKTTKPTKKPKKPKRQQKETTKQNGADSGVIFAHHVNINLSIV